MEEDVDVKATVTRLRRRLSVEQSEDGSSPGPSTPTKKRGGRLAAKPQLELIEENAQISSPRKTRRKSIATDTEEKPVTPSRRSTRIKSNSSFVSETPSEQVTITPRAKRAARRNSQAGSDNEGPATTPARQTRRTRKDSASSIENQESGTHSRTLPVAEMVIEEEPENEILKAVNTKTSPSPVVEELSPNSARKSKRLLEKRHSGSQKSNQNSFTSEENKSLNISTTNKKVSSKTESLSHSPLNKSRKSKQSNNDLSESSIDLLTKLDSETKTNKSYHNKSATALNEDRNAKSKRNRTESWPAVTTSVSGDSINFSDNELSKLRKRTKSNTNDDIAKSPKTNSSIKEENTSQSFLHTSPEKERQHSENSFTKDITKSSKDERLQANEVSMSEEGSKKEISSDKSDNTITSEMAMLFDKAPGNVQATVYYEDSDSNSVSTDKLQVAHLETEDQCVPVVKHDFQENLPLKNTTVVSNTEEIIFSDPINNDKAAYAGVNITKDGNNSCEPMDIDETIQEENLQKTTELLGQSKTEHNSLSFSLSATAEKKNNESKRKSSISNSVTDISDRSKNENKSTLILSQIKDVSSTSQDLNSPKPIHKNEVLSKSDNNIDSKNINKISKDNLSLNDVKGTPKQKIIQKLTMKTSTPITTQQSDTKTKVDKLNLETKKNKSDFSKSIDDADSSEEDTGDDEPSAEKSEFLNDEAEDASDNYESGDSQDEEERKYEEQNEIVERGETLTSDDEISNDTDYEKDSFIVSSDAEDNELLSGSGDDLSMSDNELTMSKKSKQKFNERKLKEQRNASREMFESRHKLNSSDKKSSLESKTSRIRIDSLLLASDEEESVKPKKNNRMRLNSTFDPNEEDTLLNKSKKQDKSTQNPNSGGNQDVTNVPKKDESIQGSTLDASLTNVSLNKSKKRNKSIRDSIYDVNVEHEVTNTSLNKDKKTDESIKDSTLDSSVTNVLEKKRKKINKSMQDSICNKSALYENEITVPNESTNDNLDPLQINLKQEIKTPQKHLNLSIVQFTDRQEIENVQITESNTILNETGTDPLQVTRACDDSSESSENEEIIQNYDSVLDELNKNKNTKLKNNNISLNMEKKTNIKKKVDPIFDELNLTQVKKPKKNKKHSEDNLDSKTVERSEKKTCSDNEDSSNSIDLQLLFSEDNCGSEDDNMASKIQQIETDDDQMFIPLKKSPGKTNIQESIDINISQHDTTLNESRKKKRKSSLGPVASNEEQDSRQNNKDESLLNKSSKKTEQQASLALETALESQDIQNVFVNESSTKKKKKHSISGLPVEESKEVTEGLNPAITPKSEKKKEKKISQKLESLVHDDESDGAPDEAPYISDKATDADLLNTENEPEILETGSGKKKKKKKKKSNNSSNQSDNQESVGSEKLNELAGSHKKKQEPSHTANASVETVVNESLKKKKRRKSSLGAQDEPEGELFFIDTTGTLQDNKGVIEEAVAIRKSKKKERKISQMSENPEATEGSNPAITPKSEMKKEKKISQKLESSVHDDDSDGAPEEAPYISDKATDADLLNTENEPDIVETGSGKKKKKKKKKSNNSLNQSGQSGDAEDNILPNSKKRKRKSSNTEGSQNLGDNLEIVGSETLKELAGSHKKKLKTSHTENSNTSGSRESKNAKKKNKKSRHIYFQESSELESTETQVKKSKKRKNRDEDCDNNQTKVSKDSSFREVHVTRLPESILSQLDDKPRNFDTPKVISTSNFVVENARRRRIKPSNYLEESMYIGADSPISKQKEKSHIKKPKVLPFIPTASIADSGFTTKFKINKLSETTKFEAEHVGFSKESYLQKKKIKKLGTYELYKKQMLHKMSKF